MSNDVSTPIAETHYPPEADYPTLDALLDEFGGLRVRQVVAPYSSDHARTLLFAGPRADSGGGISHVVKLARRASAEPYMLNAARLRGQLPERGGRLRLIIPQWVGRVAGRLATIEPRVRGSRVGRGAVGELLRDWLALADEFGGGVQGLEAQRLAPPTIMEFIARQRLGTQLAAVLQRHAAWLCAEPTFCHGDLSHLNVLREGDGLCLFDWDFCRRAGLRRFDGFYALLIACQPFTTYRRLAVRFGLQMEHHARLIGWRGPADEALALLLTFLAMHSEAKGARAGPLAAADSPYLALLRAGWGV